MTISKTSADSQGQETAVDRTSVTGTQNQNLAPRNNRNNRTRIPLLLAAILIATFMTSIEVTIVTTALPTISEDLRGLSQQNWVFTMYLLTTAISTPIYGKLSDQLGRRPIFITGVTLFAIGSGLCGLATTMPMLIAFRALQGLGAGAVLPVTFTIIADVFPLGDRSKIIALNNMAWGVSALLGPLVGGFIVDQISWHWIFFINVPLGIVALILILIGYHEAPRTRAQAQAAHEAPADPAAAQSRATRETPGAQTSRTTHSPHRFTLASLDLPGIIALILTLSSFLLALQWLGQGNTSPAIIAAAAVVFVANAIAFVRIEQKAQSPVIPLDLFRNKTFAVQVITASMLNGLQIGFQVYFPMWTQAIYHTPPSVAGLIITPSSILWLIASFLVGASMRRFPPRTIAIPVAIIQMVFYGFMIFAGIGFPIVMFYIVSGVGGFGLGLTITMNTIVGQAVVPERYVGTASSSLTLGRTLGQTLMTGIFGLIFNVTIAGQIAQYPALNTDIINNAITTTSGQKLDATAQGLVDNALLSAFHLIFATVVALYVVVIVANLFDPMRTPLIQQQPREIATEE
jgi:MFS family permease